MTAEDNVKNVR